jgi:hypothetical protein
MTLHERWIDDVTIIDIRGLSGLSERAFSDPRPLPQLKAADVTLAS